MDEVKFVEDSLLKNLKWSTTIWSAILEYCDPSNIQNIKENISNVQEHGMDQKVASQLKHASL